MRPRKSPTTEGITEVLRTDRVVALERLPSQGRPDLLEWRAEVERRLQSNEGQPTDPDWDIRRLIPFSSTGWQQLDHLAELRDDPEGQRVNPGQPAPVFIERGLQSLEKSTRH